MSSDEQTQVLAGLENIVPALIKFYSAATTRLDIMARFDDVRSGT